jgi:hypothetical protein
MAEESPLAQVAEIYTPFDAAEVDRLTKYVSNVETMTDRSFFANPTRSLRIEGGDDQPTTVRLLDIDEEAVEAVTGRFRRLYMPTEAASFRRTFELLKRHVVRRSPPREVVMRELAEFGPWEQKMLNATPVTIMRGGVRMTPDQIVRAYLYSRYLHDDVKLGQELAAFEPFDEALRDEFLRVMHVLARVYYVGRNVVKPILEEPSLLPSAPPVAPSHA